ncbi:putative disease resistance protein RGA4 [Miscanthus floridulus]|uniref:putative disease resistance protein RGA4 n=1 Tax=Miscanthus floridulus TaxID=154761 RepID=UPI003458592E
MAMILDAFVPMLGRMVADAVKERLDMLLGVPGEMERLEVTLEDLVNVLGDAEMKRITDTAVDAWVRELKDVMYDADDVLDQRRMEACGGDAPKRSFPGVGCCVPLFTCFRDPVLAHDMAAQIKELNRRLESVRRRSSMFRFVSASSSSVPLRQQPASTSNGKTSSVIVHADLVGEKIEQDANALVEALTTDDQRENVIVVGITGAGGIGKTTLSKRVFADQRVRDEFDLRVWVCVSQDVNEADLLWSVMVGAGGGHHHHHDATPDRSSLEPALQRGVSGKKVLLVLDDVWSEVAWNEVLQNAFRAGARGGTRVLVTTRKVTVARQMKAVHIHWVKKLKPEDGWRLLKNQVVLGRNPTDIENFKDIGMEIVTRCDCLPLAIKTVGGLLCTKERTSRDWEEVSRSAACLLGSIVRLHKLRALHIKGASWNSLEELGHLSQLSLLYLSNLEKARTSSVAKKPNLQGKHHLRYLSLECTTRIGSGSQIKDNIQQDKHQIEDVFEELCPPTCLENLSLLGFFGHQLPKWMSSGKMALKYLRSIKLEDCTNCEQLPALGHLLSLDFLLIKHAPSITRIGNEFFRSSNVTQMNQQMLFPRLEKLGFDRLDGWEEWIWGKELEQAMPNIFSLKITKCKLKYFSPGLVHQTRALKELIISEACNLTSVANFLLLSDLHLYANPTRNAC